MQYVILVPRYAQATPLHEEWKDLVIKLASEYQLQNYLFAP